MRYLRRYEDITSEPEIGDWVICVEGDGEGNLNNLISNHVGLVHEKNFGGYPYLVIFPDIDFESIKDIPADGDISDGDISMKLGDILSYCHFIEKDDVVKYGICNRVFFNSEISHWSKNKSDLETILSANKYNL